MDENDAQQLIAEWEERGRAIEAFVTSTVPADLVPITLFEHLPYAAGEAGE